MLCIVVNETTSLFSFSYCSKQQIKICIQWHTNLKRKSMCTEVIHVITVHILVLIGILS